MAVAGAAVGRLRKSTPMPAIDLPLTRPELQPASSIAYVKDDALLLRYARQALGFPADDHAGNRVVSDWEDFCDQMWLHRLGDLVWPALLSDGNAPLHDAQQWIGHFRNVTSRMNGANLLTMRRILPAFEAAGVPALAFKGPVIQQIAYGSTFMRPASDVDVLVKLSDFERAGQVLSGLGYTLADVCQSIWWKAALGEQHFLNAENVAATTVDLHHRVQQPGCPLPRHPSRLMAQSRDVVVAGRPIRTLSQNHTALHTAMSYVKALHHREPAARYAIDLVALARGWSLEDWRDLEREAREQGLQNTLALTVRACGLMLGADSLPAGPAARVLDGTTDSTLVRMTLRPGDPAIDWPRRRALLHALYDNKLAYPFGLAAMVGSDLLRQAAEPDGNRQTRRLLGA